MAVKYVKEFEFGGSVSHKKPPGMKKDLAPAKPERGQYQGYAKGGSVVPARARASARGLPAEAGPNAAARPMGKRMESMPKVGRGQGYADGGVARPIGTLMGRRPVGKPMPAKPPVYLQPSRPTKFPARPGSASAPVKPVPGMKTGGAAKGESKIGKVMGEYKRGELHSGSKKGPVVKNPKQAVAIALSEARKAGAKIPKKAEGGEIFSTEDMAYGDKKGPYRGSPKKAKMLGRKDRLDRLARKKMEHAEKYAPGLSLDMSDRRARGGMPVHRRKPMYGGGKC